MEGSKEPPRPSTAWPELTRPRICVLQNLCFPGLGFREVPVLSSEGSLLSTPTRDNLPPHLAEQNPLRAKQAQIQHHTDRAT